MSGTNFNLQKALDSFYESQGGPFPERGQDGKAKRETLSSFLQRGIEDDDMGLAVGYMGYMPMGRTNDLMAQGLTGGEQGPAQGPNTPIRNYGGQYMPYGPGGGGLPPTTTASMFGGPQMFQEGSVFNKAQNLLNDPMTIKRVI